VKEPLMYSLFAETSKNANKAAINILRIAVRCNSWQNQWFRYAFVARGELKDIGRIKSRCQMPTWQQRVDTFSRRVDT